MGEKIDELKENAAELVNDHPNIAVGAIYVVTIALMVPVCYAAYKWQGHLIGKEVAKVLNK